MQPSRKLLLSALALSALNTGLNSCGASPTPARPSKRPVVLLLFDAFSAKHVHHLGYPLETSPNLDALAAKGVSYGANFAPASYTLASIPSLFTGKLPDHHGVTQVDRALGEPEVTLAEVLQAAGYSTFGAIANIKGGTLHNLDQGFDVFSELYRPDADNAADKGAMEIVDPAVFAPLLTKWAGELEPAEPFFFYAHVLEPHMPYAPPAEHRDLWLDPAYDGPLKYGLTREWVTDFAASGGRLQESQGDADDGLRITHGDRMAIKALYDANIHYADAILGDMLEALEKAGILDDALVIVTSDHGEAMWEHGMIGHSHQVYDEMVQVPMVIRFPQSSGARPAPIAPGTVIPTMTSNLDLLPSICAWLDLGAPGELDGVPLPGFPGTPSDAEAAQRQLFLRADQLDPVRAQRGVRLKSMHEPADGEKAARDLVFNIKKDPGESINQRDTRPNFGDDLLRNLEQRLKALREGGNTSIDADGATDAEAALIRGLGYAE